jgi:hypothetical protein
MPRAAQPAAAATPGVATANEISGMTLTCRSVNMASYGATANSGIAFALASQIQAVTNYFDAVGTVFSGNVAVSPDELTITFDLTVKLKRPLKL